jgi:hypothetical protein
MDWQMLLAIGGTLSGIIVGAAINHFSSVSAQRREHDFQQSMRNEERIAEAAEEDRARLQSLRLQRLEPVFELFDSCERQLAFVINERSLNTAEVESKLQEVLNASDPPLASEARERVAGEARKKIRELALRDARGWSLAEVGRFLALTYRLDNDGMVTEMQVIIGLLASGNDIDGRAIAARLRELRARVERHAADVERQISSACSE